MKVLVRRGVIKPPLANNSALVERLASVFSFPIL